MWGCFFARFAHRRHLRSFTHGAPPHGVFLSTDVGWIWGYDTDDYVVYMIAGLPFCQGGGEYVLQKSAAGGFFFLQKSAAGGCSGWQRAIGECLRLLLNLLEQIAQLASNREKKGSLLGGALGHSSLLSFGPFKSPPLVNYCWPERV